MKPTLAKLWAHFPDHTEYPNLKSLYTMLGGVAARNINSPGFGPEGNTCASRLSIAFNRPDQGEHPRRGRSENADRC